MDKKVRMPLTKEQAIKMFSPPMWGARSRLARALKISRQAFDQWPDLLTQDQSDRVREAARAQGMRK